MTIDMLAKCFKFNSSIAYKDREVFKEMNDKNHAIGT